MFLDVTKKVIIMNIKNYQKLSFFYYLFLVIVFCMTTVSAKNIVKLLNFEDLEKVYFYSYYPIVLYVVIIFILIIFITLFYFDVKRKFFKNIKKRSLYLILMFVFLLVILFYRT